MIDSGYAFGGQMPNWLAARAELTPGSLALMVGGQRLTFGELDRRATRVARLLDGQGVGEGDRVAVFLRGALPMAEFVHGVARVGAVLVPLNVRLAPAELAWQAADIRARLLIHDSPHPPALSFPRGAGETSVAPLLDRGQGEPVGLSAPRSRQPNPHGVGVRAPQCCT